MFLVEKFKNMHEQPGQAVQTSDRRPNRNGEKIPGLPISFFIGKKGAKFNAGLVFTVSSCSPVNSL